ncbi:small-conductance mechanosensitive channel [Catalinimonas alkaloidigena]|uniref:mechanosensitive ion channel family protein n=1 Tax=Catalinimonas alkaloidigena TaxID=1075417 RepID=UPI002406DBD2|nr:mechanosensitive ion channel domain-containing protein [Catalinimonas alkaloidigena]MDF9796997.1 small-conductance mechanosensitive channel [Catalinimonas alkaloidigena]
MTEHFFYSLEQGFIDYMTNRPYWTVVFVFFLSILVGLAIRWVFVRSLKNYNRLKPGVLIESFLRNLNRRTKVFFPLLVFYIAQLFIDLPDETTDLIITKVAQAALILGFGWVLLSLVKVVEEVVFEHYTVKRGDSLKSKKIQTQLQFIRRVLVVIIVVLVLSAILLTFDSVRNIGATLLTSAGVAGIIVGFAAQKSIANFLAGLQIAITQPIKIDDSVIVEGEWGWIEEITLTYVVIKIWDKRRLVLPINYFIEKPFQNWTRTSTELLGPVMLYLDYTLPLDELRNELDKILAREKLWDRKTKVVQLVDTTEKCIAVRILVSAKDAPTAFDLRCIVREKLINFVREKYPDALPVHRMFMLEQST